MLSGSVFLPISFFLRVFVLFITFRQTLSKVHCYAQPKPSRCNSNRKQQKKAEEERKKTSTKTTKSCATSFGFLISQMVSSYWHFTIPKNKKDTNECSERSLNLKLEGAWSEVETSALCFTFIIFLSWYFLWMLKVNFVVSWKLESFHSLFSEKPRTILGLKFPQCHF